MRGAAETAGFVEASTGSHRFVLDHLVEEVLDRLPEDVRGLLLVPLDDNGGGTATTTCSLTRCVPDSLPRTPLEPRTCTAPPSHPWYADRDLLGDAIKHPSAGGVPPARQRVR